MIIPKQKNIKPNVKTYIVCIICYTKDYEYFIAWLESENSQLDVVFHERKGLDIVRDEPNVTWFNQIIVENLQLDNFNIKEFPIKENKA